MSKKCTPLWREAHCGSEQCKKLTVSDCFWKLGCGFEWHAQGIRHLAKSEQNVRVCCSSFKSVGRRGAFEEDLQRWILRGRCSTRDMFIRDVRRSGRRFPEKGCVLERQIFRCAKMILHDISVARAAL